jgi:hypothetical protein
MEILQDMSQDDEVFDSARETEGKINRCQRQKVMSKL